MMKMEKISAVYKIVNTVTDDCYVGSSKDAMRRWAHHKCTSYWKRQPNNPLYQDMQKYGVDKFQFQILCSVEPEHLKEVEQELIGMIQPTYNNIRAKGKDNERQKVTRRKYLQSEKYKVAHREDTRKYFSNKLCNYNGEVLTFSALSTRFYRAGIEHPVLEAKKYLEKNNDEEV